jgi:hypothetical protein
MIVMLLRVEYEEMFGEEQSTRRFGVKLQHSETSRHPYAVAFRLLIHPCRDNVSWRKKFVVKINNSTALVYVPCSQTLLCNLAGSLVF